MAPNDATTVNSAYIYVGPWINYDKGVILGSTITLNERYGAFLTAFLALYVGLACGEIWRILAYILHQCRARSRERDVLHHQQQAILRNTGAAGPACWEFLRMITPWWNLAPHAFWRSIPFALIAILNLGLAGVAGIFSSEVTKAAGNETIILGGRCGQLVPDPSASKKAQFLAVKINTLNQTLAGSTYARSCYGPDPDLLRCGQFIKREITFSQNTNASCPFDSGLCMISDTAAYELDSGYINSHTQLGINTATKDRVNFRKVCACAPIDYSQYLRAEYESQSPGAPQEQFQRIYMGPLENITNYTFSYNLHSPLDGFGYQIRSVNSERDIGTDPWTPISQLNQSLADVTLFFLTPNNVTYQTPVDDPFYSAHVESSKVIDGVNSTVYLTDSFIHVLGCTDRYQFCNPSNDKCTELTSWGTAKKQMARAEFSQLQNSVAERIFAGAALSSLYYSVDPLGANALLASDSLTYNLIQGPLPNDQWRREAQSWYESSLARLQGGVVQYAAGPINTVEGLLLNKSKNEFTKKVCESQKIRESVGFMCFSVLGISLILILGTLIILTSTFLEPIVAWVQVRYHIGYHRHLQWVADDKLQLQRLAFEGLGFGSWSRRDCPVPVTEKHQRFVMPVDPDAVNSGLGSRNGEPPRAKYENDYLLHDENPNPSNTYHGYKPHPYTSHTMMP